jgi:ABC-type transporter Mla subunit MlaD
MSNTHHEWKVGLFVFFCLVLLGGLMLEFSKGTTFFRSTYNIYLRSGNAGALKPKAAVLMSGVQVGTIDQTVLSPEGTNVTITLRIYQRFVIHESARFVIEQSGFLGDQYVAVYPEGNVGAVLGTPGHMDATAEEPFNLQEAARDAAGFILRIDETARKLNDAISDVRRLVLNEKTLTNFSSSISTLREVSLDARTTVSNFNLLVTANGAAAAMAVSNLVAFTEQLNAAAHSAQSILDTNGPEISAAVENVRISTAMLTNMLGEVQSGRGLAGSFLRDERLAANVSLLASNLAVTSSNLNHLGLWRVIRGVKPAEPKPPPHEPVLPGRNPF